MQAQERQIINFLQEQNKQFIIPIYQRNYNWQIPNCQTLLDDIIFTETQSTREKKTIHFIGSIVYVFCGSHKSIDADTNELTIIDGQQRLTTINILYVALYRFAKNNNLKEADFIYNQILTNQYVEKDENKLKLKQAENNEEAFKAILNNTEDNLKQKQQYSNIITNFEFFYKKIDINTFFNIYNGLKRLFFVEISLERDKDDPQRIFESLNSTGLDLSQSDLIRNFILMDLKQKEQDAIYHQIWNPIEENTKDPNSSESKAPDFIRDYLTLKTKQISKKDRVYQDFKKLYSNKKDDSYKQELENIKAFSIHYRKLINPNPKTVDDIEIRMELENIRELEIGVANPFLLQILDDYEDRLIDKEILIKILRLVQSFVWRRFVVNLPTNALNKIFMSLYDEIDQENYYDSLCIALLRKGGSGKFPNNQEVKRNLENLNLYDSAKKNKNYFFKMLENYNNREYVDTANDSITIEHIFPINPDKQWKQDLSNEDYEDFQSNKLHTIANLTLSGNNSALGNRPFAEKRDMNRDNQEQGYRYSRLWLNDYLKQQDCWNIAKYNERLTIIYERFLKIWQYPEVALDKNEDEDSWEQSIFDAELPTNKDLEYFIFEGTKVEEKFIASMYLYVLRKLYDRNPELLIKSDIIKISQSQSDFRTPAELIYGYFVEINIDSATKFSNLKKILKLFRVEEGDLMIKYNLNTNETTNNNSKQQKFDRRRSFWTELLPLIKHQILFKNVNPTKDFWLATGAGISGLSYVFVVTSYYVAIELKIGKAETLQNKNIFREIANKKDEIESRFGSQLIWEELKEAKMSRIKNQLDGVNFYENADKAKIIDFFCNNLDLFYSALDPAIKLLKKQY